MTVYLSDYPLDNTMQKESLLQPTITVMKSKQPEWDSSVDNTQNDINYSYERMFLTSEIVLQSHPSRISN